MANYKGHATKKELPSTDQAFHAKADKFRSMKEKRSRAKTAPKRKQYDNDEYDNENDAVVEMSLKESLDKAYNYKITTKGKDLFEAKFRTDDNIEYLYSAIYEVMWDSWDIIFSAGEFDAEDITGYGNQFRVFATIAKITDEFIRKYKPKVITFSAKEPSRQKLYTRFAKMIASKYNYKVKKTGRDFKLKRK